MVALPTSFFILNKRSWIYLLARPPTDWSISCNGSEFKQSYRANDWGKNVKEIIESSADAIKQQQTWSKWHFHLSNVFKLIPTLRIMMHQSSGNHSEARPTTLSQSLSTYPHSAFLLIRNGLSALTLFHSALLFFPLPSPLFFESHKNYQSRPSWKHFRATQWMLKNFLSALMKERDGKNDKNYLEPDADDFFFRLNHFYFGFQS